MRGLGSIAVVAVTVAILAGCRAAPDASAESDRASLRRSARFEYEDLVALIESRGYTSIEEVLPELPESLRASYALLYDSLSLQSASFEDPRVILFGADARLTCTFNGDAYQVGWDSLECFQFREDERAFDFRQIRFPTKDNGLERVLFSERNRTVDGQIRCTTCHGEDPRPSWDDYDQWPGAYGFDDDALGVDAQRYATFVARRPSHPRYRTLIQEDTPTAPYTIGYSLTQKRRPNVRFSDAAGRMNALRATRILESRVSPREALAFAVKALQCTLTPADTEALAAAGIDPARELDLARVFGLVGISGRDWGMKVFDDPAVPIAKPWEHQAGFGFLSIDIAMAIAQDRARAGNEPLRLAVEAIKPYLARRYQGFDLQFHQTLAEIIPDPDVFGGYFEANTAPICAEMTRLWLETATAP